MSRGLSELQYWVLLTVLDYYERVEERGDDYLLNQLRCWGAPWHPSHEVTTWGAADRAHTARAVTRLVRRGLVERANCSSTPAHETPRRATSLRLTAQGRATAERVANKQTPGATL